MFCNKAIHILKCPYCQIIPGVIKKLNIKLACKRECNPESSDYLKLVLLYLQLYTNKKLMNLTCLTDDENLGHRVRNVVDCLDYLLAFHVKKV